MKNNKGTIVGFGSVSSTIGRNVNTVYAASKRGLESLFESLSITALNSKLKIQFYNIGYLDTNLSYGKKLRYGFFDIHFTREAHPMTLNHGDLKTCA